MKFKKIAVLSSIAIGCLLPFSLYATVIPECPSATTIKSISLNVADSTGSQYVVGNDSFTRIDERFWLVAIGMIDATNQEDAIKNARNSIQSVQAPLRAKAVLMEAGGYNWWTCFYPTKSPSVSAIALSPENTNSTLSAKSMMQLGHH